MPEPNRRAANRAVDEVQNLLRMRAALIRRAAMTAPGALHDAIGFEIGELDLRLKELWSGENSGLKQFSLVSPPMTDDRPSHRPRA